MEYKNNNHIRILKTKKPISRSPQFYLLSGFVIGVLSVGTVLFCYSYYEDFKGLTSPQVIVENHQMTAPNHAIENEQPIQRSDTPSDQETIQNPEDGFDQNIENMFKIAKPKSSYESKNRNSPFESTFGSQEQKSLIQIKDEIELYKPEVHTVQSSTAKSKETKRSEKNFEKVKSATQPAAQIEKPVELNTTSTSSQEQPPVAIPQESPEVVQS